MSKKYYRFFGGLLSAQEKWLNKMADKGYHLVRVGKLLYEFEECGPVRVRYRVEFIGQKSKDKAKEYHDFLEDMGCRIFYKNMNLNYSAGKVRWRPWADKGGQVASASTTFNRELLLVEKPDDGKAFELHTTYEDRLSYYKTLKKPYLCLSLLFVILGIVTDARAWAAAVALPLIPFLVYQIESARIKAQAKTREW